MMHCRTKEAELSSFTMNTVFHIRFKIFITGLIVLAEIVI